MIVFANAGLIDLDAIRTMGVSVKQPGSFGYFGTGLKYAIATVLRNGGTIRLYRDGVEHVIATVATTIRDTEFEIVTLDGDQIGFTTQLGRNWEAWMVLREFGCNARDEGGNFWSAAEQPADAPADTVFVIDWPLLDAAYVNRASLFCEGEPIYADDKIRILPGQSHFVFYRGVRALKLPKPSVHTYNILTSQLLTEDRTFYGDWAVKDEIRNALLRLDDRDALLPVLDTSKGAAANYEGGFAFDDIGANVKPTTAFLALAAELRETHGALHQGARKLLMRYMREEATHTSGGSYRRVVNDAFAYAVEVLGDLGVKISEDQKFVTVPDLPGALQTMTEKGIIFIRQELLRQPAPVIAHQLLQRLAEMACPHGTMEQAIAFLGPLLLGRHEGMAKAIKLMEEDAKAAAAAESGEPESEPEFAEVDDIAF